MKAIFLRRVLPVLVLVGAISVALVTVASGGESRPDIARAVIHNAAGERIGSATLASFEGKTTVVVSVRGTSRGFHGFHVHERGVCEAPFTTAGGHFNPAGSVHGDHAGDMPPLLVSSDGRATATFVTDRYQVEDLLDVDGSAIIVHAGPDNLANIPTRYQSSDSTAPGPDAATLATGDAGARFGCGVVTALWSRR